MLKAAFPWFGGKSRVSGQVWDRFGNVPNYVEPFAGSLAVLLQRPHAAKNETVNDKDAYLSNFWRALQADPEAVAFHADWPVSEPDLHARHQWLVDQKDFREKMLTDPDFFDAKVAGWWVWGISQWIGSGWCSRPDWTGRSNAGRAARGVNVHRKRVQLGKGGVGVNRVVNKIPYIDAGGRGVNATQIPMLSSKCGTLADSLSDSLSDYMLALSERLRRVRVCCGDWSRILGPTPTTSIGMTAVFLDPPYDMNIVLGKESGSDGAAEWDKLYNHHDNELSAQVRTWAIDHGSDPLLRIALCGYEGEHDMPENWECVYWKANGGYSNQSSETKGKANAHRERIWFSPACLRPGLFGLDEFQEKEAGVITPRLVCGFPNPFKSEEKPT